MCSDANVLVSSLLSRDPPGPSHGEISVVKRDIGVISEFNRRPLVPMCIATWSIETPILKMSKLLADNAPFQVRGHGRTMSRRRKSSEYMCVAKLTPLRIRIVLSPVLDDVGNSHIPFVFANGGCVLLITGSGPVILS